MIRANEKLLDRELVVVFFTAGGLEMAGKVRTAVRLGIEPELLLTHRVKDTGRLDSAGSCGVSGSGWHLGLGAFIAGPIWNMYWAVLNS